MDTELALDVPVAGSVLATVLVVLSLMITVSVLVLGSAVELPGSEFVGTGCEPVG